MIYVDKNINEVGTSQSISQTATRQNGAVQRLVCSTTAHHASLLVLDRACVKSVLVSIDNPGQTSEV